MRPDGFATRHPAPPLVRKSACAISLTSKARFSSSSRHLLEDPAGGEGAVGVRLPELRVHALEGDVGLEELHDEERQVLLRPPLPNPSREYSLTGRLPPRL